MTGRLEYLRERPDLAAVKKLFGNAMIFGDGPKAVLPAIVACMDQLIAARHGGPGRQRPRDRRPALSPVPGPCAPASPYRPLTA